MNGNGELTETETLFFNVSYRVLTEFLRMNVHVILTYFATAIQQRLRQRIRNAGNQALELLPKQELTNGR